jgi:hypothetical protein
MVWWVPLAASAIGAVGSAIASKNSAGNTPTSETATNMTTRTTPYPAAQPALGFLAGNAMNLAQQPVPYFPGQTYVSPSALTQQGVQLGQGALPYYARGAEMAAGASPYYRAGGGQAAAGSQAAVGAIPGQQGINRTALGNYNYLSGAADVQNNPYVQGMLDVNRERVTRNLTEDVLPALRGGAIQVNALGSGRLGLAEGQAARGASEALSQANRQTMLDAYSQGLGAQQSALGQTGTMLQNQLAPAQAREYAARMQGLAGQMQTDAGLAQQQAGQMAGMGSVAALDLGQTVEGYQQRALRDAMARYAYQWQEPQMRMQTLQNTVNTFAPYSTSRSVGTGTAPNPNYMSPWQAAVGGASLGWGVGNQLNNWWSQNQQQTGATGTTGP